MRNISISTCMVRETNCLDCNAPRPPAPRPPDMMAIFAYSECEDGRILQRLDSFNTLINVSTLTAGFALLGLAFVELPTTRVMMLLTFILEV